MDGLLPSAGDASFRSGTLVSWRDEFRGPKLSREWSFLRGRPEGLAIIRPGGGLVLTGGEEDLSEGTATPAFIGRPQPTFDCSFSATLDFEPETEESEAGIAAYYDDSYHYEAFVARRGGGRVACLRKRVHDIVVEGPAVPLPEKGRVRLKISADRELYSFSCECDASRFRLGTGMTAGLCTEGTWRQTFTGVFFGLYCRRG
jgi:alpha-N-arabinofuranosidase